MTTEEKAKAYDIIIQRVSELYEAGTTLTREQMEYLFPELGESDDEKMRKFLLSYFKFRLSHSDIYINNTMWEGVKVSDIINYLEKQKDISESKAYEILSKKGFVIIERELYNELCEKEQKPVEWSEVDSIMLDSILAVIEEWESNQSEKEKEYYGATPKADWLKSLRPSWKPSKDEERLINTSISFLKDFADKGYENAVECIDWLKSKLNGNSINYD